jgi:hypothetical protein
MSSTVRPPPVPMPREPPPPKPVDVKEPWEVKLSTRTNKWYYVNSLTGVSTYDRPSTA